MPEITNIEESTGYQKLLKAVESDVERDAKFGVKSHDYRAKLSWIIDRTNHYSEKTGIPASDILNAWEERRNYWYMNFYQDANQPKIEGERVRVFDTVDELTAAIGVERAFRCPSCSAVSKSPYECTVKPCDWKVHGLFGDLGKGIFVFVKEKVSGEKIFMPVAWEIR